MKKEDYFKWGIIAGIGVYLYYCSRSGKKEDQLFGYDSPQSDKIMDSVIPWLKVNPRIKPFVKSFGTSFLDKVIEPKQGDFIDAEYREI